MKVRPTECPNQRTQIKPNYSCRPAGGGGDDGGDGGDDGDDGDGDDDDGGGDDGDDGNGAGKYKRLTEHINNGCSNYGFLYLKQI